MLSKARFNSMPIKTVIFDGDDTLWHHDNFFRGAVLRFHDYMNSIGSYPDAAQRVDADHIADLKLWGYGVKGFTLTMVQTAINLTNGTITGEQMQKIMAIGKETYLHPVNLLPHVRETLAALHGKYFILLITKGDLLAQEMKFAQSGLELFFDGIEIVTEKDIATYKRIYKRYKLNPVETIMIGNALRSDVLPTIEMGAHAVHIPYEVSWHHETPVITEEEGKRFAVLPTMETLPQLIAEIE